ncbi:MAG: macro domain-containing protein [Planctomycetes bacterium]|nr:macro domain-containing protein [Planctomycetota bacterium]MCB9917657.1 macro domain-containing protein [Planctomycetota bacterium]
MIREVSGDILLSKAHTIAHGVAPNDSFDRGLALSLRERWPAMHKDFRHYCHQYHPKAGGMWFWGGPGHARIANLLTQDGSYDHGGKPGRASTTHVDHALKELRKHIDDEKVTSIALPRLATGVGGLDWNDVRPLIEQRLGDLKIPVILYTQYVKGVQADEGLSD